jgi:hypothetical protein
MEGRDGGDGGFCHVVAVDDEIVPGAFLQVVVVDGFEIGVLFGVILQQELAVVAAPDHVKGVTGGQGVPSGYSHAPGAKQE